MQFYDQKGEVIGVNPEIIAKESGYIWPDEGTDIIDSDKQNITVNFGKLGYGSKVITTFEFWTREKKNKLTKQSFYEFHYRCYFQNLDPSNWKTDGSTELQCNVGLHQYQTSLDWSLTKMQYLPSYDVASWVCVDAFQGFDDKRRSYEDEIQEDQEQNCNYVDMGESRVFKQAVPAGDITKRILHQSDDTQNQPKQAPQASYPLNQHEPSSFFQQLINSIKIIQTSIF